MLNGVLIVDKPAGMTSHDVVDRIRRVTRMRRVGHTGTLDPMATGVLSLCLGKATKIAQFLQAEDKEYDVEMILGVITRSQDTTGEVLEQRPVENLDSATVEEVFQRFTGPQDQIPPMVSAKHYQGKRLYELARKGIEVKRTPISIRIWSLALESIDLPSIRFRVHCSKGTYIRTLCHDLGQVLGPGAAMSGLVRSRCGCYRLEEATPLDWFDGRERIQQRLRTIDEALSGYPSVVLQPHAVRSVINGCPVQFEKVQDGSQSLNIGDLIRLYNPEGKLLAIGEALPATDTLQRPGGEPGFLKPIKLFVEPTQVLVTLS